MLWVNLFKRIFLGFYRDREVSVPDEQLLTNDDNIEKALVIQAMIDRESNMAALRESLTPPRISEREGSTTTNVIIQLAMQ